MHVRPSGKSYPSRRTSLKSDLIPVNVCPTSIAAASRIWDVLKRQAVMEGTQTDRKASKRSAVIVPQVKSNTRSRKRPASPDVEYLKPGSEWSPPPTVVDIATNITNNQVSGDRRAPFEVLDSPSQGRPRPTPA
jgi:hypothetical protein